MLIREAQIKDITQLHKIRVSVRENILPNPDLITAEEYEEFLTKRGKGWLCELENEIAGFAIVDLVKNNIWALFVAPAHEGKGIGKKLHDAMLEWYFVHTNENVWLGTCPNTRAEKFYRKAGWTEIGKRPNGEIHFVMKAENWKSV